jgi:hypothetical protein
MVLLYLLLSYVACIAIDGVRRVFERRRDPLPPRRMTNATLIAFAVMQLTFVAVLLVGFFTRAWTPATLGISDERPVIEQVLAGEIAFLAVIIAWGAAVFAAGKLGSARKHASRANLGIWPRGRAQKWAAGLLIMAMNPFTEELAMRGVLIHHWALDLGSPAWPIATGFVLNALLHLYQGWRLQLWHALYFVVAVTLLYSPWGLGAAIVAHVLGDVVPIVTLRRNLSLTRKRARKARANAA